MSKKRIGRSKLPLAHQLPIMSENLSLKLDSSVCIEIITWTHKGWEATTSYRICIVDDKDVNLHDFATWPSLLDFYFSTMKGDN